MILNMITKIAFFLRSILYGSGVCDDPQSNDHAVLYFQTLAPLSVVGNLKQTDEIAFCQIAKVFGQITYFKMPTNSNRENLNFTNHVHTSNFFVRWIKYVLNFLWPLSYQYLIIVAINALMEKFLLLNEEGIVVL